MSRGPSYTALWRWAPPRPADVFLDRRPRKDDPWLTFKVWSFTVGAVLALAGIYLDERWLIWTAIGILLLGFAVRFLDRSSGEAGEEREGT